MYHDATLEALSKKQVSRLLNGHPVRVKAGEHHNVSFSGDQFKKLCRAHLAGKGITVTLDPHQIEHLQHLRRDVGLCAKSLCGRGTGTKLGARLGQITGDVAGACGDRAISELSGSGTGTKLGARLGQITGDVAGACGDRAIREVGGGLHYTPSPAELKYLKAAASRCGSGVNRVHKAKRWTGFVQDNLGMQPVQDALAGAASRYITYGSGVNRLHKAKRWTGFVQDTLGMRPVQDALVARAKSLIGSGKRVLSPAQKAALAKGRAVLRAKRGGSFMLPGS